MKAEKTSSMRVAYTPSRARCAVFPKTSSASDPMTGAPNAVTGRQLKEVSLRLL